MTPASCQPSTGGHNYTEFSSSPYYKRSGVQGLMGPVHNQSIAFQKLYCTMKVVAQDHRKKGDS